MKFKATIEIEQYIDDSDFNAEKIKEEKKNKYKNVKESVAKIIEDALSDEGFDSIRIKQVKIEWDKVNLQNDKNVG